MIPIALKKYSVLFLFVAAAFAASVALAGDPVHGVDVKLGAKDGKVYTAQTDHEGKFDLGEVPDGEYDLYCSYEQCTKLAIKTKGTGAQRSSLDAASKDAAKFQISLPNNGTQVTFAHDVGVGKNGSDNRFPITQEWTSNKPSLHVKIDHGKQASGHHYIGHVTIVK
jgi:hypothetical protein